MFYNFYIWRFGMSNNDLQPIYLVLQELSEKTLELANLKVAYQNLYNECEELRSLKKLVDENKDIKKMLDNVKKGGGK